MKIIISMAMIIGIIAFCGIVKAQCRKHLRGNNDKK